jgi:hypothetical protein
MSQTIPRHVRVIVWFLALPRAAVLAGIFAIPVAVGAVQSIQARHLDPSLLPSLFLFSVCYSAFRREVRGAA